MNRPFPEQKIKVCHIITKMVYGGASLGTLHIVQGLDPDDFESTIICGKQSENEGSLLEEIESSSVKIIVLPEIVREIHLYTDLKTLLKLYVIFKKNKYHIVHTHGSKAGVIGRIAAALARIPAILYTVHGWGLKAGNPVTQILFRFIERIVATFTTRLLFQTKSDMDEASHYKIGLEKQYYLIGNGINTGPFLHYNKQKANEIMTELALYKNKIIGTVGRVSAQKNPLGFVKIAQRILEKRQDVKFIFVGGGELLDNMQSLVDKLGLTRNIIFTGVRSDVPELISNFDVFILPSLWEGMPRSVIEAMVMAKPIIVYDMRGIREVINNGVNGLIIPMNNPEEFARSIMLLLDNKNDQKRLGQQAKITSVRFDFNNVVIKTQYIYEMLIRK